MTDMPGLMPPTSMRLGETLTGVAGVDPTFEVEITDDGLIHLHIDPVTAGQLAEAWWFCHSQGHLAGRSIHDSIAQTASLAAAAGQAAHDHGILHVAELVPGFIRHPGTTAGGA